MSGSTSTSGSVTSGLSAYELAFVMPADDSGVVLVTGGANGDATFTDIGEITATIVYDFTPAASPPPGVPESASLVLLGGGLVGMAVVCRRTRSQ